MISRNMTIRTRVGKDEGYLEYISMRRVFEMIIVMIHIVKSN